VSGLRLVGGRPVKGLQKHLQGLARTVAADAAGRIAPAVTAIARADFGAGRTVYGDRRPLGVRGNALSLVRSGRVRGGLRFAATGARLRCVLPTDYAKFLVGRYKVLPHGDHLPASWKRTIDAHIAGALEAFARDSGGQVRRAA